MSLVYLQGLPRTARQVIFIMDSCRLVEINVVVTLEATQRSWGGLTYNQTQIVPTDPAAPELRRNSQINALCNRNQSSQRHLRVLIRLVACWVWMHVDRDIWLVTGNSFLWPEPWWSEQSLCVTFPRVWNNTSAFYEHWRTLESFLVVLFLFLFTWTWMPHCFLSGRTVAQHLVSLNHIACILSSLTPSVCRKHLVRFFTHYV